mmetsp:Transcript_11912/g.42937  ORF Transcript_11912/g.42937 Transcript_11912/m.42937 type:complete len:604 (+) Transcript_11912:78-1889(+)
MYANQRRRGWRRTRSFARSSSAGATPRVFFFAFGRRVEASVGAHAQLPRLDHLLRRAVPSHHRDLLLSADVLAPLAAVLVLLEEPLLEAAVALFIRRRVEIKVRRRRRQRVRAAAAAAAVVVLVERDAGRALQRASQRALRLERRPQPLPRDAVHDRVGFGARLSLLRHRGHHLMRRHELLLDDAHRLLDVRLPPDRPLLRVKLSLHVPLELIDEDLLNVLARVDHLVLVFALVVAVVRQRPVLLNFARLDRAEDGVDLRRRRRLVAKVSRRADAALRVREELFNLHLGVERAVQAEHPRLAFHRFFAFDLVHELAPRVVHQVFPVVAHVHRRASRQGGVLAHRAPRATPCRLHELRRVSSRLFALVDLRVAVGVHVFGDFEEVHEKRGAAALGGEIRLRHRVRLGQRRDVHAVFVEAFRLAALDVDVVASFSSLLLRREPRGDGELPHRSRLDRDEVVVGAGDVLRDRPGSRARGALAALHHRPGTRAAHRRDFVPAARAQAAHEPVPAPLRHRVDLRFDLFHDVPARRLLIVVRRPSRALRRRARRCRRRRRPLARAASASDRRRGRRHDAVGDWGHALHDRARAVEEVLLLRHPAASSRV